MNDLSEFVTLSGTTLVTDSRRVAKHFGKRHDNVLQSIDGLDCSDSYRALNFQETMHEVPGPKGAVRNERIFSMTKNGFIFLVMSFRGAKAAQIKEAYISAFDAMAESLQSIAADGFRNLWDQRLELEKKDATSFMWASFGAKRMLERRNALPALKEVRSRLETEMAPGLFPSVSIQ